MRRYAALFTIALTFACANKAEPASGGETPPETAPAPPTTGADEGEPGELPTSESASRPSLTAGECEAAGGTIVGDIGDGAIHKPGYTCADTGLEPIGTITPEAGGPIAVEGSVCCPKAS